MWRTCRNLPCESTARKNSFISLMLLWGDSGATDCAHQRAQWALLPALTMQTLMRTFSILNYQFKHYFKIWPKSLGLTELLAFTREPRLESLTNDSLQWLLGKWKNKQNYQYTSAEHLATLPHRCSLLGEGKLLPAAHSLAHHCPVTAYRPDISPSYCDPSPLHPSCPSTFLVPRIAAEEHILLNSNKPIIINMALPGPWCQMCGICCWLCWQFILCIF